jgi:phosphatidylglycerol:prolipoprotein diacylglycerol transferase
MGNFSLAYLIDLGWFRIGPPYIYLNIDPVIFRLGPLAVRWYGLMYVVGIMMGLWAIKGYTARKGVDEDMVYRVLWWCIAAGLIGGRLYFVIQQPDLVPHYILQPWRILATWEGGMAFYGAIFLVIATLFWRARVERINPLVLVDCGVLFASVGQIFGRFGNIINGDIIGFPSTLPWSTVYVNPNSWACLNPNTCNVPVQPAAAYEILCNIVLMVILFYLASRVRRPGILALVYLFGYAITQFLVFFVRANDIVSFLGLNWGLKQAQWTSLVVFIVMIPISFLIMRWRFSRSVPVGEVAATYGMPQKPAPEDQLEEKTLDGEIVTVEDDGIKHVEPTDAEEEEKADSEGTETPEEPQAVEEASSGDAEASEKELVEEEGGNEDKEGAEEAQKVEEAESKSIKASEGEQAVEESGHEESGAASKRSK